MATDLTRSPEARELAERVLVTLVHALGPRAGMLTVLGGLVPPLLTAGLEPPPPAHIGTTDVDVLLSIHLGGPAEGYEALEAVLQRVGFTPDAATSGWRWRAAVGGFTVKIEFLCDLPEYPQGTTVRPTGCAILGACNLRGTGFVAGDWTTQEFARELVDRSATVAVSVRVAGLAGYLTAKAFAITGRGEQKDYYDFAYVLIHNSAGGPEAAGGAIRRASFWERGAFLEGRAMSGNQIEFVNLIVDHLTEHGVMKAELLYESPFTDVAPYGPDGLFAGADVDTLIATLRRIRATAVAA